MVEFVFLNVRYYFSQSIFVIWHHRTCFTNLRIAQYKKLLVFYWFAPPFFQPHFCLPIRCGNFFLHCFIHTNCFNHKTLVNDMPCKYRLSMCKKCVGHTQPIYLRFYKFPNNQNIISSLLTTFTHSDSPLLVVAWTHIIYYCLLMKFVNTLLKWFKASHAELVLLHMCLCVNHERFFPFLCLQLLSTILHKCRPPPLLEPICAFAYELNHTFLTNHSLKNI